MDENKNQVNAPESEEGGLDIVALLRSLWAGRKRIIITTVIFIALGLVAALTMKRTYTVSTVMVPQLSSARSSQLSGLAALAGFDMGSNMAATELSPLVYPQIVNSVPYRLELMHTPLHYMKCDTMISMIDYSYSEFNKPTVMDYVLKYTIGLPGLILSSISKPTVIEMPVSSDSTGGSTNNVPMPVWVSGRDQDMLDHFGRVVSLDVDKKEGYVTLNVTGSEPIQTAELAMKAQQLLQDEITRFRVEKSQSELEYIQARYDEIKRESESYQVKLASLTDRSQGIATRTSTLERERIQTKFTVTNAVFTEMAKQLEQAKMQVKKDTPVFTILQPVTVPMKPSNSRAKTLIVWTFFGFVLGCGLVLWKGYKPKLVAKFKKAAPETSDASEQPAEAES